MYDRNQFSDFVDCLTPEQFTKLSMAVWARQDREAKDKAKDLILTNGELVLIEQGRKIEAIRAIQDRTHNNLAVCKAAVDLVARK